MSALQHPFIDLDPTDLADWIGMFCARRVSRPPARWPPFPSLVAGESTVDWLARQFQLLGESPGLRQKFRYAIKELVATQGGRAEAQDRDQILGILLSVARELQFIEIADDLVGWVRSGWVQERHRYRLDGEDVPIRRTTWAMLIAWNRLEGLQPQLVRDLANLAKSGEPGTAQLCFLALGQHDVAEALQAIPLTVSWPEGYWSHVMQRFFVSVGASNLLKEQYANAWSHCLGRCFYDPALEKHVRKLYIPDYAEFDMRRENRLWKALDSFGIEVTLLGSSVRLESDDGGSLSVDVSRYTSQLEASVMFNAALETGASLPGFS